MPGAGSAEPNRNTTMMQEVKTSFLRRSGVLNAWANLITVATALQCRRAAARSALLSWKGQVCFGGRSRDRAEWRLGAPAPVYRGWGATTPNPFGGRGPHNPISLIT